MKRRKPNIGRALTLLTLCAACHDETAIVGRVHRARRDAAVEPPDASASKSDPSATNPGTPNSTAASEPGDLPALAPPSRQKAWFIEPGNRDQFCAGHGSALRSPDCVPIERQLFAYSLCSCGDVYLTGDTFSTDGFDSSQAAHVHGRGGAAVGVNGTLHARAREIDIAGSLTVAGPNPIVFAGNSSLSVHGDLETNADIPSMTQNLHVDRNVWHAGDVALSPPCACSDLLDIAGIVAKARDVADNDEAGFAPDSLRDRIDTEVVSLPCGRLVVSELTIPIGTIALTVSGRTALFVAGDVDIVGTFGIVLAPGAELDMFVAGDFRLQGSGGIGTQTQPSATRIYVAGQVDVAPSFALAVQLYAPRASISGSGLAEDMYGALFAGSFTSSGSNKLHYDRASVNSEATCQAAAHSCSACDECADGLACANGTCEPCAHDSDCCAPFVCSAGRCGPLLVLERQSSTQKGP